MALNKASMQFVRRPPAQQESSAEANWVPNTDVYLTEGGLVVKVELAGMRKEDLHLMTEDNQLRITGQRPDGCRAPKCQFVVMEICYGPFESVIEIPAGYDLAGARASYQNGFLRIDVPQNKKTASEPRVVPIVSS